MTSLSPEAETAYAAHIAPLDFVEGEVAALVEAQDMLRAAWRAGGGVVPYSKNLTAEALARRITAVFLNAGFVPPLAPSEAGEPS